jgi:hypothetical protein
MTDTKITAEQAREVAIGRVLARARRAHERAAREWKATLADLAELDEALARAKKAEAMLHSFSVEDRLSGAELDTAFWKERAEKAEASAAEMRAAMAGISLMCRDNTAPAHEILLAVGRSAHEAAAQARASTAGTGWRSPEEWATLTAERDELRNYLANLIDILTLKGHAMSRRDWGRATLLSGRTGAVMPDWDRDAARERDELRATLDKLAGMCTICTIPSKRDELRAKLAEVQALLNLDSHLDPVPQLRAVIESRDTVRLLWAQTVESHRHEIKAIELALTEAWDGHEMHYRCTQELNQTHAALRAEVDKGEPKPDQHDRKTYCERCRQVTLCRSIPSPYDGTYWRCSQCAEVVEP